MRLHVRCKQISSEVAFLADLALVGSLRYKIDYNLLILVVSSLVVPLISETSETFLTIDTLEGTVACMCP